MDALVFKTMKAVAAAPDDLTRETLMEQSNKALGEHFRRNRMDMEEMAADLLNIAWADAMENDPVPQVIDTKTVDLGAVDWVDENLRGLRAYWQGKGGQIESDMLRYERTIMPREEMVAAIDLHRDEIALDFWGTYQRLLTHSTEKLQQLPATRLAQLIQSGITAGSTYGSFAASSLSAAQIDPILEFVAYRSYGNVSILGTRPALRALSNIGVQFGPNVAERVFNVGQVGVYKGYGLIQYENFEDFGGSLVFPNNELWLVGRNAGRLTYYGQQPKTQELPKSGFYVRYETARDAGMLLYGIQRGRLGRIVLT